MKSVNLVISGALLLLFSVNSGAAYIGNHLAVGAFSSTGSSSPEIDLVGIGRLKGNISQDTGLLSASNGSFTASGQASASTSALKLKASSRSSAPSATSQFSDAFASASFSSYWRDLLYVSGSEPIPSQVRFNFSVHASLSVSPTTPSLVSYRPNVSRSGLSLRANPYIGADFPLLSLSASEPTYSALGVLVESIDGAPVFATAVPSDGTPSGWDSASLTTSDGVNYIFNASFSLLSDVYTAALLGTSDDAYMVSIGLAANTSNRGGTSEANASNTLLLSSVTMPDGSPLPSGLSFNFDTGASLASMSAVPLPAAAWLFGSGLIGLVGVARREGTSNKSKTLTN